MKPAIPIKNKKKAIISACDAVKTPKSKVSFTRIFSIKNRSNPLSIKYKANKVPGTFNFFLKDKITRKSKKQITDYGICQFFISQNRFNFINPVRYGVAMNKQ